MLNLLLTYYLGNSHAILPVNKAWNLTHHWLLPPSNLHIQALKSHQIFSGKGRSHFKVQGLNCTYKETKLRVWNEKSWGGTHPAKDTDTSWAKRKDSYASPGAPTEGIAYKDRETKRQTTRLTSFSHWDFPWSPQKLASSKGNQSQINTCIFHRHNYLLYI